MDFDRDPEQGDEVGVERDDATIPEDERQYLIPASDARGHSERVYCRVQPAVLRLLEEVVGSHKYPFRTRGDALRYCVVNGLKKLAARKEGIPSVIAQAEVVLDILRDDEFQHQFALVFDRLREVVERYQSAGAHGEARRVVSQARANFDAMPEGYWKARYLRELIEKYGLLLDGKTDGTAAVRLMGIAGGKR